MDYAKKLQTWRERRITAMAWIGAGMPRKEVAKRLKITRQRLSQIESYAKHKDEISA